MNTCIVIGGERYDIGTRVVLWDEKGGLETKRGAGAKQRVKRIDTFVVHWTGAENPPRTVHQTLISRSLGIEFINAADGTLYQTCDPMVLNTYDSNFMNARSVGIENVCCGTDIARSKSRALIQVRGFATYRDLTMEQYDSLTRLTSGLIRHCGVRPDIPVASDGRVYQNVIDRALLEASGGGVLGHYHIRASKRDPGPLVLEHLKEECGLAGWRVR